MPAIAPMPKDAKVISAASFYAQQNKAKTKKKKSKTLVGIKKMFTSKTSQGVTDSIMLYAKNASNSNTLKKTRFPIINGKSSVIVPKNVPELAKSASKVTNGSFKGNNTEKEKKSPAVNNTGIMKKSKATSVAENKPKSKNVEIVKKISQSLIKPKETNNVERNLKIKPENMKRVKSVDPQQSTTKSLKENSVVKKVKLSTISPSVQVDKESVKSKRKVAPKLPAILSLLDSLDGIADKRLCGMTILKYLIAPYDVSEFFSTFWEKKHLLIQRKKSKYMDGLFSTSVFDDIIRHEHVEYTKNLDVTSYSYGVRQTHNPAGRVYPAVVWDYFSNGCSLRMLNPQTFHEPLWILLSTLQEYMGSFCGANIYLTPAATQGFAPHWDDIEAFIIQLEGKKRWRVYEPRNKHEVLPRFSSKNLKPDEIGSPILDVILEAGDLLYFPRGYIHQAEAVADTHSLHITLSSYQKNSWVDLFEKMFTPESLSKVASTNSALRQGLPRGCFEYMGALAGGASQTANKKKRSNDVSESVDLPVQMKKKRKEFKDKVKSLMMDSLLADGGVIDRAVDAMAQQFVRVALPPAFTVEEYSNTVAGDGERWGANGVEGRVEIEPTTRVKLLAPLTTRVVECNGEWRLYHSVDNSREYEGREEQFIVLEEMHLIAMRHLQTAYPAYTTVEDLPLPVLEDKMTLAMSLWEHCLLVTEEPLDDDDDDMGCCDDSSCDCDE